LERKVVSGHEIVTHPSSASAHDDVAASVCGCLVAAGDVANAPMHIPASVFATLQSMGNYNARTANRQASGAAHFGERRWGIMQRAASRRLYGF
jgi:hypothetical protein